MGVFNPISKVSRIEVVDVLRGFALFGVLIANIPFDKELAVQSDVDRFLGFLYDIFVNRKFITLFSMLFGFGFYIQMTRAAKKGLDFKRYFLKRMGLLFLIGVFHCLFIWNGDILMSYAVGGVFLLLVRNWSVKNLTLLAIGFSVILTGLFFIGNGFLGWQQHHYDPALIVQHPIVDSYTGYLHINFRISPWVNFLQDMPITLVFAFGNMLVGFILGKINFFRSPKELKQLKYSFVLIGFTLGIFCSYLFHLVNTGRLELGIYLIWLPFVVIAGMMFQTLAYMTIFVKLSRIPFFKKLTSWFKYVGRTALSNYIIQSLLYLVVFFHAINPYGLFGSASRGETYLIAFVFFALQSTISYAWLREYAQGPIEYFWRKMSYHRVFPQKRKLM